MDYELCLEKLTTAFGRPRIMMQDRIVWDINLKCGWMGRQGQMIKIIRPVQITWKPYMETMEICLIGCYCEEKFVGPITNSTLGYVHRSFNRARVAVREALALKGMIRGRYIGAR